MQINPIGGDAQRENEIPSEMKRFEGSISALAEAIKGLDNRLSPVVHAPEPTVNKAPTAPPNLSPIGQWLGSQRERIQEATEAIRSILGRLEI